MGKKKIITVIALMLIGFRPLSAQEVKYTTGDVIGRNLVDHISGLDTMQIKKIPAIAIRRQKWNLVDRKNKYIQALRDIEPHVIKENGEIYVDYDNVEDIVKSQLLVGYGSGTFEKVIGDSTYLFCMGCLSFGRISARITVFSKTNSGYRLHSQGEIWDKLSKFVFRLNGEDITINYQSVSDPAPGAVRIRLF